MLTGGRPSPREQWLSPNETGGAFDAAEERFLPMKVLRRLVALALPAWLLLLLGAPAGAAPQ